MSVDFKMSFWCPRFFQKTNLKIQIFALAYWGWNFLYGFWKNWKKESNLSLSQNTPISWHTYWYSDLKADLWLTNSITKNIVWGLGESSTFLCTKYCTNAAVLQPHCWIHLPIMFLFGGQYGKRGFYHVQILIFVPLQRKCVRFVILYFLI